MIRFIEWVRRIRPRAGESDARMMKMVARVGWDDFHRAHVEAQKARRVVVLDPDRAERS
jgi:hypothetical protein